MVCKRSTRTSLVMYETRPIRLNCISLQLLYHSCCARLIAHHLSDIQDVTLCSDYCRLNFYCDTHFRPKVVFYGLCSSRTGTPSSPIRAHGRWSEDHGEVLVSISLIHSNLLFCFFFLQHWTHLKLQIYLSLRRHHCYCRLHHVGVPATVCKQAFVPQLKVQLFLVLRWNRLFNSNVDAPPLGRSAQFNSLVCSCMNKAS